MRTQASLPVFAEAGCSFLELLVALLVSSVMFTVMSGFFRAAVETRHQMSLQTEAQQGLRALMEVVTQELRQAGACLPSLGQFVALGGTEGGSQDSLTLRIGKTDPETLVCIRTATNANASAGESTLQVDQTDGFQVGDLVYVTPNGAEGGFYTLTGVGAQSLTLSPPLSEDHPLGTGIYALDERVYAVDPSTYGRPVLTVAMNGGSPQPLVDGVEAFNIQYLLAPCPPCTPVDLPADATEWRQVREVSISATVRSYKAGGDGQFLYESGQFNVKPRNLK